MHEFTNTVLLLDDLLAVVEVNDPDGVLNLFNSYVHKSYVKLGDLRGLESLLRD